MGDLHIFQQKQPLHGTILVPGDKSISHRAVLLGALADGQMRVHHWLPAGDTLATLQVVRALGGQIEPIQQSEQAWELKIDGQGLHGLQPPSQILDCRNAGTCIRLLAGILAGQPFASQLDGSPQLRRRPMRRITTPLRQMGALIHDNDGYAPLTIQPAALHGITYPMPTATAQVKSAILLAGLFADGETGVLEPGPSRDHTERMLQAMGVQLEQGVGWIKMPHPPTALQPVTIEVPADISSAAFPLIAALLVPHSQITLTNVCVNPTRTGILDIVQAMGANITLTQLRQTNSREPIADLVVQATEYQGITIGGQIVVRAIDEFPILAVFASQAAGKTIIREAAELRIKEVDRISVLVGELRKMGAQIEEQIDGFTVYGPVKLKGAMVDSHEDHRLAMALAVAGMVAEGETVIKQANSLSDSFPGFVETMQKIGAQMAWMNSLP